MSIIDDGVEFETIWDGSHQGKDADLFNAIEAPPVIEPARRRTRADPTQTRGDLLALMAERELWTTKELLIESELSETTFWSAIQYFRRSGLTYHPERGYVTLAQDKEAA